MVGWNLYYFSFCWDFSFFKSFFHNCFTFFGIYFLYLISYKGKNKKNFHGRFWYLEWPESHFCKLDKTWACLHVCVNTRWILPSFTGSCKPYQNLENMPSQCSLTWCDCRGWVVACLIINQSPGIRKENTLCGAWFKFMGRGGRGSRRRRE